MTQITPQSQTAFASSIMQVNPASFVVLLASKPEALSSAIHPLILEAIDVSWANAQAKRPDIRRLHSSQAYRDFFGIVVDGDGKKKQELDSALEAIEKFDSSQKGTVYRFMNGKERAIFKHMEPDEVKEARLTAVKLSHEKMDLEKALNGAKSAEIEATRNMNLLTTMRNRLLEGQPLYPSAKVSSLDIYEPLPDVVTEVGSYVLWKLQTTLLNRRALPSCIVEAIRKEVMPDGTLASFNHSTIQPTQDTAPREQGARKPLHY